VLDTTLPPGEATSDSLVQDHLYLVQHIVNQLASRYPRHIDRSELWSAGAHGLVEASQRYDASTGVPFDRYASIRIRGAIIDSTRTRDIATRRLRRDLRTMNAAADAFEAEQGRSPMDIELAGLLGITADEIAARKSAAANTTVLQLDMPIPGSESEGTLADRLAETTTDNLPEEHLEATEMIGTVRDAVAHLDPVHREVIERHFFDGELLRDIAGDLGCTEARVSQLRSEALHAMRAVFAGLYDGVPDVPESAPGQRRRAAYVATVAAQSTWRTRLMAAAPAPARSA
jgi:RNA polymerase sigma factor FliA